MQAWLSLLKKEIRLTRGLALAWLAALVAAGILGAFLLYRYHVRLSVVLVFMAAMSHMWYLPFFLLYSLSAEWRQTAHLWLQTPRTGWTLLAAKLVSGLFWMAVSFLINALFVLWFFSAEAGSAGMDLPWPLIWKYGFAVVLFLFATSVYMGLWAMLISVAMAAARRWLNKGRWLIGLAVFLIGTWGIAAFSDTAFYRTITKWGSIGVPVTPRVEDPTFIFRGPLYAGEILFYAVIAAAVFYLSGWLLEKRVEV